MEEELRCRLTPIPFIYYPHCYWWVPWWSLAEVTNLTLFRGEALLPLTMMVMMMMMPRYADYDRYSTVVRWRRDVYWYAVNYRWRWRWSLSVVLWSPVTVFDICWCGDEEYWRCHHSFEGAVLPIFPLLMVYSDFSEGTDAILLWRADSIFTDTWWMKTKEEADIVWRRKSIWSILFALWYIQSIRDTGWCGRRRRGPCCDWYMTDAVFNFTNLYSLLYCCVDTLWPLWCLYDWCWFVESIVLFIVEEGLLCQYYGGNVLSKLSSSVIIMIFDADDLLYWFVIVVSLLLYCYYRDWRNVIVFYCYVHYSYYCYCRLIPLLGWLMLLQCVFVISVTGWFWYHSDVEWYDMFIDGGGKATTVEIAMRNWWWRNTWCYWKY